MSKKSELLRLLWRLKTWSERGKPDTENTYIEILIHLGSDSVVVGEVVISERHQHLLILSPVKGKKFPETVRVPRIHLPLVSHSSFAFRKGK